MDATQINKSTDILQLLGYQLRKAGGYHVGPCPFCGGVDRFTVKHTPKGDRWHCRQCSDGKYHTAIDFIMRRENSDFKDALQVLGGETQKQSPMKPRQRQVVDTVVIPSAEWQAESLSEIGEASSALDNSKMAQAWLTSRGLLPSTWAAWLIGFYAYTSKRNPEIKIPTIAIPWYEMSNGREIITAVKYRVIGADSKFRYFCKEGSKFEIPFGLSYIQPKHHDTLLFVEGEINCISIWQCQIQNLSVLSFGNEGSGNNVKAMAEIASRYKHVYIWADDIWDNPKPEKVKRAEEFKGIISGNGCAIRSVKKNDVKFDANQLLKSGVLPDFMNGILTSRVNEMEVTK